MKRQDVVTVAAFMFSRSTSIGIALSFGVTSLALSMGSVANAVEVEPVPNQIISQSSQSTVTERADQEKPTKAASDSNTQPASPISSQVEQPKFRSGAQKEDQVNIEDVPEICRAYFPLGGSVSLFDYQQAIERCEYGR